MFFAAHCWLLLVGNAYAFDFNDVARRAKHLADSAYQKPVHDLPSELKSLSYDQYRDIRFKPEAWLWRSKGLPFEAAFFHRSSAFPEVVKINEIVGNTSHQIKFSPEQFDYGANKVDANRVRNLGFSGLRIHFPVNQGNYKDEVLSFLGASYFRALGKSQLYGASVRGLAVDTAKSSGEEFPRFTEFWLERPAATAKQLTIYALLDSPRVTGAYRFVLTPGEETAVDVKVRLYLRKQISLIGIAPLTSMFLFGENQHPTTDDYRPEVHDSDGLSIHTASDEWIWRPLVNPKRLLVTSFAQNDVKGFGLMQRDRKFEHYEDLGAHYQQRPSIWVEPKGKWGKGRVELVQIPVPDETNDNIVAYWVAESPNQAGQKQDFEYRMLWQKNSESQPPNGWVVQSRRGRAYTKALDGSIGFLVDFDGPAFRKLAANIKPVAVVSSDPNGQLVENELYRNEVNGTWRLSLRVKRIDNSKPVELRAQLRGKDNKESETWSYILPPE